MSDLISIKGGRDGLRLRLDDGADWPALLAQLERQLEQNQAFFSGARLQIEIGSRALSEEQLGQMLSLIQQHGVTADGLQAEARQSRNAARAAGLPARPLPRQQSQAAAAPGAEPEALLVARTVRSGQVLRHHGHITLLGDVNPGGEVIAGGSVVVWGRLRGLVHAGALGAGDAVVCALELQPTQLRIAAQIATAPSSHGRMGPEVARIEDGQIVVGAWESHRR